MSTSSSLAIRPAQETDVAAIFGMIHELAVFEKLEHMMIAKESMLHDSLFGKHPACEALVGEEDGEVVTFALFFHNFSTFLGKANLYLEDLFVLPEMRGKGFGKILLAFLGKIAVDRDCGRLDWWCLDWNTSSIDFYREMGAVPMSDWTVFREEGENLKKLADMV